MKKHAFTLIELLIVVAIIAILAAIAVPNFLEAQTRAKVSRVKSDMRTLVTATEAYRVDFNAYPPPSHEDGYQGPIPYPGPLQYYETKTSVILTTPIAYITSRPFDVFRSKEPTHDGTGIILYHYATRQYAELAGPLPSPENFTELVATFGGQAPSTQYYYLSHGPDNFHNGPDEPEPVHSYDPTNGSVSGGDLIYFAPGGGFKF